MDLRWRSARASVMGAAMTMIAANVAVALPALSSNHIAAYGERGGMLGNGSSRLSLGAVGRVAGRLVELVNGSDFLVQAGAGPGGRKGPGIFPRDRRPPPYVPATRQLPEPGSLWILGVGLAALGIAGSRIRKP